MIGEAVIYGLRNCAKLIVAISTFLTKHTLNYALYLLLTALDTLWCTYKMVSGDGEVPTLIIGFKASLSVSSLR
jgi:hypothetical protein